MLAVEDGEDVPVRERKLTVEEVQLKNDVQRMHRNAEKVKEWRKIYFLLFS